MLPHTPAAEWLLLPSADMGKRVTTGVCVTDFEWGIDCEKRACMWICAGVSACADTATDESAEGDRMCVSDSGSPLVLCDCVPGIDSVCIWRWMSACSCRSTGGSVDAVSTGIDSVSVSAFSLSQCAPLVMACSLSVDMLACTRRNSVQHLLWSKLRNVVAESVLHTMKI